MHYLDTIVANATPPGRGGIGIIRVSGPLSYNVAKEVLGIIPEHRKAEYLNFLDCDGKILDHGIALFFCKPHSFTGEDVLELQGHGGQIVLDLVLQRVQSIPGIRIAKPGEFSERAFINNKLDLTQAEAISDLINASSTYAARAALNSLNGTFSYLINKLSNSLTNLRTYIEANINFSDEEIFSITEPNEKIINDICKILNNLEKIHIESSKANLLQEEMKIIITGKPNSGKSTLFNILSGQEHAIVTNIAGTTRDILRERISINGIQILIVDTAGIHDDVFEEIEKIGIEKAWNAIKQADHILIMLDTNITLVKNIKILKSNFFNKIPSHIPLTLIRSKADLTNEKIGLKKVDSYELITISAKLGQGIDILQKHLIKKFRVVRTTECNFLTRRRHLEALEKTKIHLLHAKKQFELNKSSDLFAEDLRLAQNSLDEITGKIYSNKILEKIFSEFCIGK